MSNVRDCRCRKLHEGPCPQLAPLHLSTPVPLPWDMPTLSREDARIARERVNPTPRMPEEEQPAPSGDEAKVREMIEEMSNYWQCNPKALLEAYSVGQSHGVERCKKALRNIVADAIARRGSEG